MGVVVRLPRELRDDLAAPMGPVHTDTAELLAAASAPIVAVGDVVTRHLERAGRPPDVAVFDGRTQREPAADPPETDDAVAVENPAGTITSELATALRAALDGTGSRRISVDGEEDLAALPAVLAAPTGASVVYGQPGEGMVHVRVTDKARDRARELLGRFEGDPDRLFALLGA